jgi:hypothetical protein
MLARWRRHRCSWPGLLKLALRPAAAPLVSPDCNPKGDEAAELDEEGRPRPRGRVLIRQPPPPPPGFSASAEPCVASPSSSTARPCVICWPTGRGGKIPAELARHRSHCLADWTTRPIHGPIQTNKNGSIYLDRRFESNRRRYPLT